MKYLIISVMCLGFLGCSDDSKEAIHNVREAPELQGGYTGTCKTSGLVGVSEKTRFIFEGNSFTKAQIFYGEADCATETGRVEYKGEFRAGDDEVTTEKTGGTLDLEIQDAVITISSDNLAKTMNAVNYCGHTDYAAGKEVTLTGRQTSGLCPVMNVPVTLYTTYRSENDRLYLSDLDLRTMSETSEKRSSDIIYSNVYVKDDAEDTKDKAENTAKEVGDKVETETKQTVDKVQTEAKEAGNKVEAESKEAANKAQTEAKEAGNKIEQTTKDATDTSDKR